MKKCALIALFLLHSLASASFAQTPQTSPKLVSAGVVNGRSTNLVRPPYPAAARAVKVSGSVNVSVTISEDGKVISAQAISGHPLLRAVSVQAARESTFAQTFLDGKPVKVIGIIVYNFVGPMSMTEMGFELARAERSEKDRNYVKYASIASNLPDEMTDERKDLSRLAGRFFPKPVEPAKSPEQTEPVGDSLKAPAMYSVRRTDAESATLAKTETPMGDPAQFIENLRLRILEKLGAESANGWQFDLGAKLQRLDSELSDAARTIANLDDLKAHAESAPETISPDLIGRINDIVANGIGRDNESLNRTRERIRSLRR